MNQPANHSYEFGPFRLDAGERLLLRDGAVVQLTPKAFDLLLVLVEQHGHLLEKSELLKLVWPDTIVEEANLSYNISLIRKALSCGKNGQRYIETVPRRGYRFIAPVREQQSATATPDAAAVAQARGVTPLSVIIKSIAVLPFKPIVASDRNEALEIGMADTLINKLSNLRHLVVRPTSAVRKYAALDQDPLAAGREQRVDAVLESSFQRSGEKIRVTVRLVQVSDGAALWAYRCDEDYTDVFAAQDIISEKVAGALMPGLTGAERKLLAKRYTDNFEAYQLYVKGHFFWDKRTEEGIEKSIEYFEQAIRLDPNYALAYAGLATTYVTSAYRQMVLPAEADARAEAATREALELDEQLGQAHSALGVLHFRHLEWSQGVREFERAIELNPSYATAHMWYSYYLMALGRFDQAIAEARRAQELDPLSLIINTQMGTPFFYMREYDRAIEQYRKALEIDPQFPPARYWLGRAYTQKGNYAEAIECLLPTVTANPRLKAYIMPLAYACAVSGQHGAALKLLDELRAPAEQRSVSAYYVALIYAGLGEPNQSFDWLERAYQECADGIIFLNVEPGFDGLRSEQRFQELLRRMRLAS
jgi:DNA-binding winged helix-turn-helix (wHTH) protein/tetratricopeptide (TPR) repeat protein